MSNSQLLNRATSGGEVFPGLGFRVSVFPVWNLFDLEQKGCFRKSKVMKERGLIMIRSLHDKWVLHLFEP
jgi:hypothetical protein